MDNENKRYNGDMIQLFWTTYNTSTGTVDPENLSHMVMQIKDVIDQIMDEPSKGIIPCVLIHPKDAGDFGTHKDQTIDYGTFFKDPCKYGVILRKGTNQTYMFE